MGALYTLLIRLFHALTSLPPPRLDMDSHQPFGSSAVSATSNEQDKIGFRVVVVGAGWQVAD